ncbi:hypothetical protein GA512_11955 [Bacillus paralicheniformis]|nr:hypothetical protein [Bacillus paralicheniformis]
MRNKRFNTLKSFMGCVFDIRMKTDFVQAPLLRQHFLNRSVSYAKRALANGQSLLFQLELLADEEKALLLNHGIKSIEEDFV